MGYAMDDLNVGRMIIEGIPNFLGFVLMAFYLQKTIGRTLDLLETCLEKDSD